MTRPEKNHTQNFRTGRSTAAAILTIAFALAVAITPAQAQTYGILHNFTGKDDGAYPITGLTKDAAGNLYGTTSDGGFWGQSCDQGCGTVFKLTHKGSSWIFATLYAFQGEDDGEDPAGNVIFGPDGSLYGATSAGLPNNGTVYNLKPPPSACKAALCPWSETVLFRFDVNQNGASPDYITFDPAGNIYGTAQLGGPGGNGLVYKLTTSGGAWTQTILNAFQGGGSPQGGVILDKTGNVYGTAYIPNSGWVYRLPNAGGQLQILHQFKRTDGDDPFGGLIWGAAGNLNGGALCGGQNSEGTVYQIAFSGGGWTFSTLYNFTQGDQNYCGGPYGALTMDAAGNLYGTQHSGGAYQWGAVFKLTPTANGWTYTSLHDFCAGGYPCSDGAYPFGNVVIDSAGNVYGTASFGGKYNGEYNSGVVWRITP